MYSLGGGLRSLSALVCSCDIYTVVYINQGSLFAFLNILRKLQKVRQINDYSSNINAVKHILQYSDTCVILTDSN